MKKQTRKAISTAAVEGNGKPEAAGVNLPDSIDLTEEEATAILKAREKGITLAALIEGNKIVRESDVLNFMHSLSSRAKQMRTYLMDQEIYGVGVCEDGADFKEMQHYRMQLLLTLIRGLDRDVDCTIQHLGRGGSIPTIFNGFEVPKEEEALLTA